MKKNIANCKISVQMHLFLSFLSHISQIKNWLKIHKANFCSGLLTQYYQTHYTRTINILSVFLTQRWGKNPDKLHNSCYSSVAA